jgi:hypothetical protein
VVIFFAGALYHALDEWTCDDGDAIEDDDCEDWEDDDDNDDDDYSPFESHADKGRVTPGRIGTVLFFPKITLERVEAEAGGTPGWNHFTSSGKYPDPRK